MFYDEQNEEDRAEKGIDENVFAGGAIITFCLSAGLLSYVGIKAALALWHFWVG